MKSIYRNKASVQWCTKKYLLYTAAVGPKRWRSDGCGHSCGKVRTSDRPQISNSYVQSWTKITDRKFRPRSPPNQGWENFFWPLYGFILDWGMRWWEWGFLFHFFLCKIVLNVFVIWNIDIVTYALYFCLKVALWSLILKHTHRG